MGGYYSLPRINHKDLKSKNQICSYILCNYMGMSKVDTVRFSLNIPAGGPVSMGGNSHLGAIFGQKGVKPQVFFKDFNDNNGKSVVAGSVLMVTMKVHTDDQKKKTIKYRFCRKQPAAKLLKKAAGDAKIISEEKVRELAREKIGDTNCYEDDIESAFRTLKGTAKSCGIVVEGAK
jgi:ribosomal protein L11